MKDVKIQKSLDLRTLIGLMQIPEVNEVIKLKVEELMSGEFEPLIRGYSEHTEKYYQSLFECRVQLEEAAGNKLYPPLHWFELYMYSDNFWGTSCWDSSYGRCTSVYDLLPKDVLDLILEELVEPGKIHSKTVYSRFQKNTVDLQFVRMSPNHIVGTVRENYKAPVDKLEKTDRISDEQQEWQCFEKAHRVLSDYHRKYPEMSKFFIKWYVDTVLPVLKSADAVNSGKTPPFPFKVFFNKQEDSELPSPGLPRKVYRTDPVTGERSLTVVVPEKLVFKTTEIHLVPTREVTLAPGETAETVEDPEVRAILESPDTAVEYDGEDMEIEDPYLEDYDYVT